MQKVCENEACGKTFETQYSFTRCCSQKCRVALWRKKHKGEIRSPWRRRPGKLNGYFCQRCARFDIQTPLRGNNHFNCPQCWDVLNATYAPSTYEIPRRGEVAWR